ncbi:HNH endonuclease family protein [Rhodococcus sp. BH5]|uniref:HNH endonuclease family protein n=1 Tax=Rhodococcus sp. BH5 TaxID=2871702 RepID=UPI0022CD7E43|nr:HNH endonuclease family protein [Rhodococcus sp. BH5]MCZ9635022.1 HNH endonuclease family protein [Rhodococcus sp. BH5]
MRRQKTATSFAVAGFVLAAVSGCAGVASGGPWTPAAAPAPAPAVAVQAEATNPGLDQLIGTLTIVDTLPNTPGYERGCGKGESCAFGTAWTDKYEGPLARNGCDTRNDVLGRQLVDVAFKPGTRDCKVVAGTLHDPYTGTEIAFTPSNPSAIQIDHVFALSRAWDAGASAWTPQKRINFANDTDLNLLASQGKANQSKSDQGLDTWLPSNTAFHCEYAEKYLTVAATYQLAVTAEDVAAARTVCAGN